MGVWPGPGLQRLLILGGSGRDRPRASVEKNCRQIEQWPSDQIREQTGKRSTMDLINRTFTSSDGHTRGVGFPYNYHNSFWSNYFANYWHPSSYYRQQLECPDPVPLLPGYYVSYDPLLAIPGPSDNIRSRSRQFYSSMVITRSYPAVNI